VVTVTGSSNKRVSLAALIAVRPGHRPRLTCRTRTRRPGDQRKGFTETGYARFLDAAHQQLGGPLVVIWDKCAVWRFVASPSQSGGIWRNIPGSPGLPGGES
jgi:hypothetical protein